MKKNYFNLFIALLCALTLSFILSSPLERLFNNLVSGIIPVLLAFFIAYLLDHVVSFFEKLLTCARIKPRLKSTLCVILGLLTILAVIAGLFAILLPAVVENVLTLNKNLDNYAEKLNGLLSEIDSLLSLPKELSLSNLISSVDEEAISGALSEIISTALNLLSTLSVSIVLSVLILFEKKSIKGALVRFCDRVFKKSEKIKKSTVCIKVIMDGFLYGKLTECAITGGAFLLLYLVLKLPYALLFALLIGMLYVIPYLGGYIGLLPAVLVALFINPTTALTLALSGILLLNISATFVSPIVYKNNLNISPLTIMASTLIGGSLAGIVGFLCAPPVAATFKFLLSSFVRSKNDKQPKID